MTHVISKLTLLPGSALLVIACSHSSPHAAQQASRENAQERMEERNELAQDQREERNELAQDQREEQHEDHQYVAEANQNQNQNQNQNLDMDMDQRSFTEDARGRLANLDARASKLQAKANLATGDKRRDANQALSTVSTDVQQINERLNALPTMPADRMAPAKTEINDRLSLLDGKLDRLETMLGS